MINSWQNINYMQKCTKNIKTDILFQRLAKCTESLDNRYLVDSSVEDTNLEKKNNFHFYLLMEKNTHLGILATMARPMEIEN